ncbi:MAG: hypothetical protein JSR99_19330 [Proteobacteria bacterium]|nr:hypothetical protein [Pseudomonadota bacterium]
MTFAFEIRAASANGVKTWVDAATCGLREMARGRKLEAAHRWLDAAAASRSEEDFDPIEAASRSNAGIAHSLLGNCTEAEQCLADSERAWRRVIHQSAFLDIPITGASSSFHFRLAASGPEALIETRRRRYVQLSEAALAMTRFNRLFADSKNPKSNIIGARARELRPILAEILGPASPETRLLSASSEPVDATSVYAIYADKLTEVSVRTQTFAAALSDRWARLETAIALTALMALPVIVARNGTSESAAEETRHTDCNPSPK